MKFLALSMVAALAATAVGKKHQPEHDPESYRDTEMVLVKSERQFSEMISTRRVVIVNFSKQLPECIKNSKYEGEPLYCDFVTRAKSKFREVSKTLRHSRGGQIATLARVDCERFSQLCEQEGIDTYPTLKAYSRGRPYEVYTGTPTVAFVAAFVERVAFNTIRQIVDEINAKTANQITPSDKTIKPPAVFVPAAPAVAVQSSGSQSAAQIAPDRTKVNSGSVIDTGTSNENVAHDVINDMESMRSDVQAVASFPVAPLVTEEPKVENISYTQELLQLISESEHPRLVALLVVFLVGTVVLGLCTCVLACLVRNHHRHGAYAKVRANQSGELVCGPMVNEVESLVRRESKETLLPSYADAVAESPEVRKKLELV